MKKPTDTALATLGDHVLYVMPNGDYRPAVVVRVWEAPACDGDANLQVFTDGSNDVQELPNDYNNDAKEAVKHGLLWATSICRDEDQKLPNTWHAI
jgi:hypothetical protein